MSRTPRSIRNDQDARRVCPSVCLGGWRSTGRWRLEPLQVIQGNQYQGVIGYIDSSCECQKAVASKRPSEIDYKAKYATNPAYDNLGKDENEFRMLVRNFNAKHRTETIGRLYRGSYKKFFNGLSSLLDINTDEAQRLLRADRNIYKVYSEIPYGEKPGWLTTDQAEAIIFQEMPPLSESSAVSQNRNSPNSYFGLVLGKQFPRGLPACSSEVRGVLGTGWLAAPKRQPVLCVGATEGGLKRQTVIRSGIYRFVSLLPSDAVFARDLPGLAKFPVGNHGIYAIIDNADTLQGLVINSATLGGSERQDVIGMFTQKYGVQPKIEQRTFAIGAGQKVTTFYYVWKTSQGTTRVGPPEDQPQASLIMTWIVTPHFSQL